MDAELTKDMIGGVTESALADCARIAVIQSEIERSRLGPILQALTIVAAILYILARWFHG